MSKEKSGNWFMRHKFLTGILGLFIVIGLISALSGGSESGNESTNQQEEASQSSPEKTQKASEKERLTLDEGWKLDKSNPYMTQVVGSVSNNSDQPVNGYIQITFSALDSDGANVGDCLANANTVDANGTWKFKAMCSGENIDEVRFKELTGF